MALARDRAAQLTSAQVDEAGGELAAARALLRSNPLLEGAAGARISGIQTGPEYELGIRQNLELGGQRAARIDSAEADVLRATRAGEDALRLGLREVALGFFKALAAQEYVRLATAASEVTATLQRTAERRLEAGDLPVLDYNSAVVAHARAEAERMAAIAERATALGDLRALVGLPLDAELRPVGELRQLSSPALADLLAKADTRADLQALGASIDRAEAEARLGSADAWPELGVGAQYKREGPDHVVLGLLSITLPFFERGQALRHTARARAVRLRLELQTLHQASAAQIAAAFERSSAQGKAAELLRKIVPTLDENESLALKAFTAGELGIRELLVVRQQVLDTRRAYVDQLFAAAAASVELQAHAGVLR